MPKRNGRLEMERGEPQLIYRGKAYYVIENITKSYVDFGRPEKIGGRPGIVYVRITRKRYDKFMRSGMKVEQ